MYRQNLNYLDNSICTLSKYVCLQYMYLSTMFDTSCLSNDVKHNRIYTEAFFTSIQVMKISNVINRTYLQHFSTTSSKRIGKALTLPSMSFEICIIGCKLEIVQLQNLNSMFPQPCATTTMMYMSPRQQEHHMPLISSRQTFSQNNKLSLLQLPHIYNSKCQQSIICSR
jgi:hypothetical protein